VDERAERYLHAPPGAPAGVQVRGSLRALDLRWVTSERRRFLIFAQGRAGGTLLGTLLDDHPQVACEGEVLYRPVALPRVWCHAGRARHRGVVYGCRVKIYQLTAFQRVRDPGRWLRSMHRVGWQIVYLRRDNLLRQVLSGAVLSETGVFHRTVDDPTHPPRVRVDLETTLELLDVRASMLADEAAALRGLPHLELHYERDLLTAEAQGATMPRVFEFLGLDEHPVVSPLRRTGASRLVDQIENHDELAAALAGTPHAAFLDD
jgi:LPS sulfotransferase NodH